MPTIQEIKGLVEPIRLFNFMMTINPLGGPGGPGGGQIISPLAEGNMADGAILSLRCQSTVLPAMTNTPCMVHLGGFEVPYPGLAKFDHSWPTTFVTGSDGDIINLIHNWALSCTDPENQASGLAKAIKANALISLFAADRSTVASQRTLFGVWPQLSPGFEVNVDSPNPVTVQCTWFYDYWEMGNTGGIGTGTLAA